MQAALDERIRERMAAEKARTAPPPDAVAVPPIPTARYVDPAFFELERERVFARSWLFAGHESEWPEHGSYRQYSRSGSPLVIVRGEDGDDRIAGYAGADRLDGGSGDDLIFGGAGDDVLIGGRGNDVLIGGDYLSDAIYNGFDAADYSSSASSIDVDLDRRYEKGRQIQAFASGADIGTDT
ncbi:hypothetical protein VB854_25950, partial [Limnoraphis robusta CCNP1315]|nr:hypothetical protein [Limnoraphis robusta CCNP1315]